MSALLHLFLFDGRSLYAKLLCFLSAHQLDKRLLAFLLADHRIFDLLFGLLCPGKLCDSLIHGACINLNHCLSDQIDHMIESVVGIHIAMNLCEALRKTLHYFWIINSRYIINHAADITDPLYRLFAMRTYGDSIRGILFKKRTTRVTIKKDRLIPLFCLAIRTDVWFIESISGAMTIVAEKRSRRRGNTQHCPSDKLYNLVFCERVAHIIESEGSCISSL